MFRAKEAELWLRKRLPQPLRQVLRLGKRVFSERRRSAWIPAHLLAECRVCASRFDLVEHFPRGGRVAEIGTHEGVFARHILKTNAPQELHLVDADMSFLVGDVADDPAVTLHCGLSHQILQSFQEDYFDWIYIDADHSFAGVSRDADLASTKIRPGGYLVFNDFAHADQDLGQYGVHRAVVDFSIQNEWPFVWWAYEPSGLYDVALQRPQ